MDSGHVCNYCQSMYATAALADMCMDAGPPVCPVRPGDSVWIVQHDGSKRQDTVKACFPEPSVLAKWLRGVPESEIDMKAVARLSTCLPWHKIALHMSTVHCPASGTPTSIVSLSDLTDAPS